MLYNREEYILRSHLGEEVLYLDPMGSEDTTISIGRSEKTFGMFTTVAQNLKFIGPAKAFLDLNFSVDGFNAYVELIQKRKNNVTDDWDIAYKGYLDFETRQVEGGKFSIDFIEGGLKPILEAQAKEKFEVNTKLESISGKPIPPLVFDELTLEGREIFQSTKFYSEKEEFIHQSGSWGSNNDREAFSPFPYKRFAFTHDFVAEPYETVDGQGRWLKDVSNMIVRYVPYPMPAFPINFDWDFEIKFKNENDANRFDWWVVVEVYGRSEDNVGELKQQILVEKLIYPFAGIKYVGRGSVKLDLEEGDSVAVGVRSRGRYGGFLQTGGMYTQSEFSGSLNIPQDSFYERTGASFITAKNLGRRLTEIYTGSPKFESSFLDQGSWKDLGFTTGGHIRNLKKKVETTNKDGVIISTEYKDWPLTISWNDYYDSINAVLPVGFGIASRGAKQFVRMEPIRFFFRPVITLRLGEVSNFVEASAPEFVYGFVTTGYAEGGDYEQELGLDEYNIQTTWGSPLIRSAKKYSVISPSRADAYAVELARRYPAEEGSDRDTPFDSNNFLVDAKLLRRSTSRSYFGVRLWQDDFEREPNGVYSPGTAFNLRLSPANNMKRHSVLFNAAMFNFPQDKLRHASSEGNSELETKMPGKPELKESSPVTIKELSNPIFEAEWYTFELPRTQKLVDQIKGTTVINGEEVNNYYGIVEFKAKGQVYRGYLFTAEIKNTITFKVLKTYGF